MKHLKCMLAGAMLGIAPALTAQISIEQSGWKWEIGEDGCAERLIFQPKKNADTIPFFQEGNHAGPSFYLKTEGNERRAAWHPDGYASYVGEIDGIQCRLTYTDYNGKPAIRVRIKNASHTKFQPQKAGLKLGIDTYMDQYPQWFGKYFPTLMRNEKTHFYGYMQTPGGQILALASPDPIASWSVDYNLGYQDPAPYWFYGHRIESLNLDLMNALPLPDRHPQHLYELAQGETREWTIAFLPIPQIGKLEETIAASVDIPLFDIGQTSYKAGEEATCLLYAHHPQVRITDSEGKEIQTEVSPAGKGCYQIRARLENPGLYTLTAHSDGKQAEAILTVHQPWQWVMKRARENAWRFHQKPTSHAESWYGFYSAFLAARYFPDKELDKKLDDYFELLYTQLHDSIKVEPLYYATRIQNTSTTIGMLVDRFEAKGDVNDLERAARLGDWLIRSAQREDGAYCNHGTIYTSVIYVAKSMLELALAERNLAPGDKVWDERAKRHYDSAKRAIDQLVSAQGNFQTEGEHTFEDGMISCSALQIGMLAILEKDPAAKKRYTEAMLSILDSHACLTQLRVPDARRRQGTMRFWDTQYDVQTLPNMFNSPHGWSAWRAYATYYAYLLTGDEKWLLQTYNAMGAFSNLIDSSGKLRWAFVVDPYLEVEQACSADTQVDFSTPSFGNPHPKLYDTRHFIIGEEYVNMISDWQTVNTQDNDVHEVFKCLGETFLTNAFIVERADGSIVGYNCQVRQQGNEITVTPDEPQITNLHVNLRRAHAVRFKSAKGTKMQELPAGYMNFLNDKQ